MAITTGASGKTRRKCPVLVGALAMAVVLILSVCLAGQAIAAQKKCSVLFICNEYPYYDYGGSEGLDSEMFWDEMTTNLAKFNFSLSRKDLNPIRYEDLRNYDIVVFSPFWRNQEDITPPEGEALVQYVKNGGSLFLLMNNRGFRYAQDICVPNLNNFCEKYFGISYLPYTIAGAPDNYLINITDLKPHPVTSGVDRFLLIGGVALKIQPPATGLAYTGSDCWLNSKVDIGTKQKKDPGEPSGPFPVLAVSQYGSGKVVAVTDAEWIPGYPYDVPDYVPQNHQKLLLNILQWLSDKTDNDMTVNQPSSPPATTAANQAALANQAAFVVGRNDYSVNGTVFKMDVAPFIERGRVFVPLRYLAYALGVSEKNVVWDASSQTIELHTNEKTIKLTLNNQTISINNKNYRMDTSPVLRNGRLFLPARWVAEALGYTTGWDNKLQAVLIGPLGNLPDAGSLPLQVSVVEKSCSVLFICDEYHQYHVIPEFWEHMAPNLAKYNFTLSRKELKLIKYEDLQNFDIVVFSPCWRDPFYRDRNISELIDDDKYDITPSEAEALVQYVKNGGSLFLLMDEYDNGFTNLNSYCEKYFGIKFLPGAIMEVPKNTWDWVIIKNLKKHPTTTEVDKFIFWGGALKLQPPAQGIAYTDSNSWLNFIYDVGTKQQKKDPAEPSGPLPVMAVSQYGTGKVVVAAGFDWISASPDDLYYKQQQKLFLNILQWLSNKTDKNITEDQQTTSSKPIDTTPPNITIKKPVNGNAYKKGNNIEIEADVTDNLKVEAMGLYVTDPSGKETKIARVPVKAKNYTFKYTLKTDKFKDGKYVIKVTAVDPSNNFAFKTVDILFNVTKLGNVIVYRHDALKLAQQGRLYVVGDNGAIYKKKIKNNGSTDDEFICRDEIFQGKKGQVFISGNRDAEDRDKLYWNTEKEDRLYSIIPEKLSRVNQIIEEQKIIWQGADNAYYGKSGYKPQTIGLNVKNEIQKKADARAEAYRKAKKGDFSDPVYKEMEKRSFIARTGTTGEKVKEIQGYLKEFCSSQKVDGKYGPVTFNNVAYFQIMNKKNNPKLDVTGYVDQLTYDILKKAYEEVLQKREKPKAPQEQKQPPTVPVQPEAPFTIYFDDGVQGIGTPIVNIKWTPVARAQKYVVLRKRKEGDDNSWQRLVETVNLNYSDKLSESGTYEYKVSALSSDGHEIKTTDKASRTVVISEPINNIASIEEMGFVYKTNLGTYEWLRNNHEFDYTDTICLSLVVHYKEKQTSGPWWNPKVTYKDKYVLINKEIDKTSWKIKHSTQGEILQKIKGLEIVDPYFKPNKLEKGPYVYELEKGQLVDGEYVGYELTNLIPGDEIEIEACFKYGFLQSKTETVKIRVKAIDVGEVPPKQDNTYENMAQELEQALNNYLNYALEKSRKGILWCTQTGEQLIKMAPSFHLITGPMDMLFLFGELAYGQQEIDEKIEKAIKNNEPIPIGYTWQDYGKFMFKIIKLATRM